MKAEYLSDVLDGLDPALIDSVNKARNYSKKKNVWAKWIAAAACFALITASVFGVMHNMKKPLINSLNPTEESTCSTAPNNQNGIGYSDKDENNNLSSTDSSATHSKTSKSSASTDKPSNVTQSGDNNQSSSGNSSSENNNTTGNGSGGIHTEKSTTDMHTEYPGFNYDPTEKVYIAAPGLLQRDTVYTGVMYNAAVPISVMLCDTIRVFFEYDGKEWLVQFWKGQYNWTLVGCEIGIYTLESTYPNNKYYKRVTDEESLVISTNLYRKSDSSTEKYDILLSRNLTKTWYLTGFTPNSQWKELTESTESLMMDTKMVFDTTEQAQAFMAGVANVNTIENTFTKKQRSFSFKKLNASEYEKATDIPAKYALMNDGKTVRLSWK